VLDKGATLSFTVNLWVPGLFRNTKAVKDGEDEARPLFYRASAKDAFSADRHGDKKSFCS